MMPDTTLTQTQRMMSRKGVGLALEEREWERGEKLIRDALASLERIVDADTAGIIETLQDLVLLLVHKKNYEAAERAGRRLLAAQQRTHAQTDQEVLDTMQALG